MDDLQDVLLMVDNLKTYFELFEGTVRAVDGVSFQIRRGRTLGVIGESGCGKSVTAQSIMRLVPEPPGKIVDGEILLFSNRENSPNRDVVDIAALSTKSKEIRKIRWNEISMIFQEPMTSLSPVHTVGSQIVEAIQLHMADVSKAAARERAIELLDRVGIPQADHFVDAYSYQFSGGMRQRAMIAMALSCYPRLLIADEPTTALDVTVESQILALIKDLQAEYNMAMMYISHDLAVVGGVSDDVMVMYLGQVVENASVDEIFDSPLHPYTRALWRSIPTIDGSRSRLTPVAGTLPSPYRIHRGCRFYSRCEEAIPGKCDMVQPELVEITPGHYVRCHRCE